MQLCKAVLVVIGFYTRIRQDSTTLMLHQAFQRLNQYESPLSNKEFLQKLFIRI